MTSSLLLSRASLKLSVLVFFSLLSSQSFSQLSVTITQTINTNCNGTDCNYSGPSILINELMISPTVNDGSMSGPGPAGGQGEWIELYNPDICEPVDISCYYLGNFTHDVVGFTDIDSPGGFQIPENTIIPPAGFCMVRGANMTPVPSNLLVGNGGNVVEVIVPLNVTDAGVCVGDDGYRLWFPNSGGWFAFYDSNGIPQDAVSWGPVSNTSFSGFPCVPVNTSCNTGVAALNSYTNIDPARKTHVNTNSSANNYMGQSLHRSVDGGAWAINSPGTPTYADCNGPCFDPGSSSCTGTATANPAGGTAPYSYSWDDSQAQSTQTAIELCDGTYNVTVTDALGETTTQSVTIVNNIPVVSFTMQDDICVDENGINLLPGASPAPGSGATGTFTGNGVTGSNFYPAMSGTGTQPIIYTYTDAFGCTNDASDQIVVNPLPVLNITTESPYCYSNEQQILTVTPTGGYLLGDGIVGNVFVPSAAGVGNSTVTYDYTDANGCHNTVSTIVTVVANPSPAMAYPDFLCIHDDAIPLSADPSGGEFEIEDQSATSFDPQALGAGEHFIAYEYTNSNGCIAFALDSITVLPRPALDIDLADNYCEGTGYVALNPSPAGGTLTGPFITGTGLDLVDAPSGLHSVDYEYTDANGCENSLHDTYTISAAVHPDFTYTTNCAQVASFLNLTSPAVTNYSWIIDNQQTSVAINPAIPFVVPGDHTVQLIATDSYNCVYDTAMTIFVKPGIAISDIAIGNIITANGDGINDYVDFPSDFLECYTYTMVIVNRWGNLVFEMSNTNNRFYGLNTDGNELPEGVYFYRIDSPDIDCEDPLWKPICSGNITISR